MAKQLTTMQTFLEKHGFLVANYIYFKVIVGDKSDDLPGVEGIGEKTFLKLYPHATTEVIGSLEEIFDHARHAIASKSPSYTASILKRYQDVLDAEMLIRKNYQLMQLNNVDISIQSKDVCRELQLDSPNDFNRMKLRMMFIRDRLNGQIQYFEDWARVFTNLVYNARSGKLP
jgi:5'-3' exonuclease